MFLHNARSGGEYPPLQDEDVDDSFQQKDHV